jgi:dCTP deaminase
MILTGSEIKKEVIKKNIFIDPFNEENINPNSYNYSLGTSYIEVPENEIIDSKKPKNYKSLTIPEKGLILKPNTLYLANTFERIGSKKHVTSLIGKSSMGRLGLFLQIAADLGHQNEIHQWTLELRCCKPLIIYPKMVIGQVTFWETKGEPFSYKGFYTNFNEPTSSKGL